MSEFRTRRSRFSTRFETPISFGKNRADLKDSRLRRSNSANAVSFCRPLLVSQPNRKTKQKAGGQGLLTSR